MFIDYVTLLLINMTAGLFILAFYLIWGINTIDKKRWSPAFGITGFIATIFGIHMSIKWPLPGSFNVAFGELSVLFGTIFLATSIALAKDWKLNIIALYAFFSGILSVLIGIRLIDLGMTQKPIMSGIGFILTGTAGIFSFPVLKFNNSKFLRTCGVITLITAAAIWAMTGYIAYWSHIKSLTDWNPTG